MRWDLFCRVIDNHGDLGVCWRLACDLASRGDSVRLVVDDARALAWMAPGGQPAVQVLGWNDPTVDVPGGPLPDVVVEAFGCDPPDAVVRALQQADVPPVWVNLEYLSAEPYVERSHRLPSPRADGLVKWFFYPGFTARTGGLLREPGLLAERQRFDGAAWLSARGWAPEPGERVVSLFGYALPQPEDAVSMLAGAPTLVLAAPCEAARNLHASARPPGLRMIDLPWLTQADYDRLLWSCDLNTVRGEDSFVRAQWAGRPMLWQVYPQHDGAHVAKLGAWLDRCLQGAPPDLAAGVRQAHQRWNGLATPLSSPGGTLPPLDRWQNWQQQWAQHLAQGADLVTQLRAFAVDQGRRQRDKP